MKKQACSPQDDFYAVKNDLHALDGYLNDTLDVTLWKKALNLMTEVTQRSKNFIDLLSEPAKDSLRDFIEDFYSNNPEPAGDFKASLKNFQDTMLSEVQSNLKDLNADLATATLSSENAA